MKFNRAVFAPAAVTAVTAISAVGDDAEQTCTSIRAGVAAFTDHPYLTATPADPAWDDRAPLTIARAPRGEPFDEGPDRLLVLALGALRDLVGRARVRRRDLARTALLLALPGNGGESELRERSPDREAMEDPAVGAWKLERTFAPALCLRAGLAGLAHVAVDASGHAGGLRLIGEATKMIAEGAADRCIVVAVDSYLPADRLRQLDRSYRAKSARAKDGFLPGEAAVALLVERPERSRSGGPLALVTGAHSAREPRPRGDRASSGAGLSEAIRGVTTTAAPSFPWVLCDLNGESYRSFEWGVVRARLGGAFADLQSLVHPADCTGDVGAATGGILAAVVTQAFSRGHAPARRALLWASSDDGLRTAVTLEAPL